MVIAIEDARHGGLEVQADAELDTEREVVTGCGTDDEDEDTTMNNTAWEDLPAEQQEQTLKAGNDYSNLTTRTILAITLAEKRLRVRFIPGRELRARLRLQRAREQIAALRLASWSRHEIAKRNVSFGATYDTDIVPSLSDPRMLMELVGEIEPDIVDYDFDANQIQDRDAVNTIDEADQEEEEEDGPAVWHLTERERLNRIRRRRESKFDPFAAPEEQARLYDAQHMAAQDDDLVELFQRTLSISTAGPSPPRQRPPTSFRIGYLLNVLQYRSQSRARAFASRGTSAAPTHTARDTKRVRFHS